MKSLERTRSERGLLEAERELARLMAQSEAAERRVAEAQHEVLARTEELLRTLHLAGRLRCEIGQLRERSRAVPGGLDGSPASSRPESPPV